jgi:hypothetical protein
MENLEYLLGVLMGALIMPLTQQIKTWLKVSAPIVSYILVLVLTLGASFGLAAVIAPTATAADIFNLALVTVTSAIGTKAIVKTAKN